MMTNKILKKIFSFAITLLVIVTVTFVLMKNIPGDPFSEEQGLPAETVQFLRRHYGLDQPWYLQYTAYLKSIITWDLGPSYTYDHRTVNQIINSGFPISALLGLEALFIALSLGLFLGSAAAVYHNHWQDRVLMIMALFCLSVPSFLLATLLQYLLAVKLSIFPVARWGSFLHSVLPALSLAALPTAFIARLTRSNMLEVLQQDYIKLARAKGLSPSAVILHHALCNAIVPLIPYFGQLAANILVGSFVVEKIFAIPGLGQWFVMSIYNRDYTVIMGTTVFYSIILLSAMLLIDLVYLVVDPRIGRKN